MSIEIIPAGASAVVTERHRDHDHDRGGNCGSNCGSNCCYDPCRNGKNYDDGDVQIMRDVKDARQNIIETNTEKFIKTYDDIRNSSAASSLANSHTVEVMQNGFGQAAVASTAGFGQVAVATTAGFAATSLAVANAVREVNDKLDVGFDAVNDSVQSAHKESQVLQLQLATAAVRDACENQGKTMLAFKDVQIAQEKLSREGELQAATLACLQERLAAQASKEAAMCCCEMKSETAALFALQERLAAQASKEAALCCCETKATIVAEGTATRALMNDIERDRLRDGKARAVSALAAYFAGKVPPVTPVI